MFESNRPLPPRKWTRAIGILVVVFPVVVYMNSQALISKLPFGIGEGIISRAWDDQLKTVFPGATAFSAKQETPLPHFVAYMGAPVSQTVAGYVFWTTELQPLERGYDGPIKMLVGLDTNAKLTGVLVTEQHEPYGYFSVLPRFARQFSGLRKRAKQAMLTESRKNRAFTLLKTVPQLGPIRCALIVAKPTRTRCS